MYSTEYQIRERSALRRKGEVCFLASWVLIGRPNLVQKAQVSGEKPADCDTNCKFPCFIYLPMLLCNDISSIIASPSPADSLVRSRKDGAAEPVELGQNPDGDEVAVFDVHAILPQFVVEVTLKQ